MDMSKVSSKWQVVIPGRVREAEQIRVGSEVTFERTAQGILLRPVGAGGGLRHPQDTAPGGDGSGYRADRAGSSRAQGAQAQDIAMIGIDTNIVLR